MASGVAAVFHAHCKCTQDARKIKPGCDCQLITTQKMCAVTYFCSQEDVHHELHIAYVT